MKRTQLLAIAALSVALASAALGGTHTITWSAQNSGAALGDSSADELATGALVRLGYFEMTPDEVAANFNNVSVLEDLFTEVSSEKIGNFGGVLYGKTVETSGSGFGVSGAFAQTITLDSDSIPAGTRFYIWVSSSDDPITSPAQGIFSDTDWYLSNEEVTALQWGIENVDPSNSTDLYLANDGPEMSLTVGGRLNKLRLIDTTPVGPGDLEDPDGNGIVVLLEEAFLVDAAGNAHAQLPYMASADVLVYNRKSNGAATGWDVYRAGDLEYRVEVSSDFRAWQLASEVLGEAGVTAELRESGGERVSVTLPTEVKQTGDTYFRVHVRRIVDGGEPGVVLK